MKWVIRNRQRKWKIDWQPYLRILDHIAHELEVIPQTCTISIVRNKIIRELKRKFLNVNEATDVLAFPMHDTFPDGERYLGDIVISVDKVFEQAEMHKHSPEREFALLLIHGFLHLLGYDHEKDHGEMKRIENSFHAKLLNTPPFHKNIVR